MAQRRRGLTFAGEMLTIVAGAALYAAAASAADAAGDPALSVPASTPTDGTGADAATSAAPLDVIPVPQQPPAVRVMRQSAAPAIATVIVTARRTEEDMQDVPVAVSAFSEADLRREQINTPQDLNGRVPSLQINTNGQTRATESPTIRGQGATGGTAPGVVIYYGEVPLPADPVNTNQGGPGKFFDLANLQVLKGAQGTLFGRNTTGGALLLQPQRPQNDFAATLRAEAGSYSGQGYEGVLNVPLVDDVLLLRAGAKYFDRDGFTHDVGTGIDYDDRHYLTARLGVLWRPNDDVENYLLGHYTRSRDHGTSYVIRAVNSAGFNRTIMTGLGLSPLPLVPPQLQPGCLYFDLFAPSTNCGQDIVDEQDARDPRHVENSADPDTRLDTGGIIDTFSWQLGDNVKLRNIASYSTFKQQYRWDLDGSRAAIDDNASPDDVQQTDIATVTEELQLQGQAFNADLQYVVGGYYESTRPKGPQEVDATALFRPVVQTYELRQRSISPYAQGTYHLGGLSDALHGWHLTVGARYNFDWFRAQSSPSGNVPVEKNSTALTYTAGLDRKFDRVLLFGKISRGYKAGGFATRAVNPDHFTYRPEKVTTYEVGSKSDFAIGEVPGRVNASLYYSDYTDMQRAVGDSYVPPGSRPGTLPEFGGAVLNVGKATIKGAEFDALIEPYDGVTLSASYSYTLAQNEKFRVLIGNITPQRDCSGAEIENGGIADFRCIPFQNVPKHQYSFSARYRLPLDLSIGPVDVSLTYTWIDKRYSALSALPSEEPGAYLHSIGLLNASLSWARILGSRFDLQVYGTNLADKTYRISNSNVWNLLYVRSSMYGEPRMLGVNLGYSWGADS